MKKFKLISFLLALMMLLSACGQPNENAIDNDKTDTENKIEDDSNHGNNNIEEDGSSTDGSIEKDDQTNDKDPIDVTEENPYINCKPGSELIWDDEAVEPDEDPVDATSKSVYLAAKRKVPSSYGDWYPWEQFSALGEFGWAYFWASEPDHCQYRYLYDNPHSKKTRIYHVTVRKLPDECDVTNIREFYLWFYGNNITEKDLNAPIIKSSDLSDPDLTKLKDGYIGVFIDKELYIKASRVGHEFISVVEWIYNGYWIKIYSDDSNSKPVPFDSSLDVGIIQKLLNANTYKEAIAELMDPANGK